MRLLGPGLRSPFLACSCQTHLESTSPIVLRPHPVLTDGLVSRQALLPSGGGSGSVWRWTSPILRRVSLCLLSSPWPDGWHGWVAYAQEEASATGSTKRNSNLDALQSVQTKSKQRDCCIRGDAGERVGRLSQASSAVGFAEAPPPHPIRGEPLCSVWPMWREHGFRPKSESAGGRHRKVSRHFFSDLILPDVVQFRQIG